MSDMYPVTYLQDFSYTPNGYQNSHPTRADYQIPVAPHDIPWRGVITPFGLFGFKVMIFRLKKDITIFSAIHRQSEEFNSASGRLMISQ